MRVFVAGGTGVIGRRLVPQLVARGHQVTATTTSAGMLKLLQQMGAEGVVMDGLNAASVGEAVVAAPPGRDRAPDDGPVRGALRQAQPEKARPLLRYHQPAPQRGNPLAPGSDNRALRRGEGTDPAHVAAAEVFGRAPRVAGPASDDDALLTVRRTGRPAGLARRVTGHERRLCHGHGQLGPRWRCHRE
jgi:hypothetical protein